jgi:hypothetical protein
MRVDVSRTDGSMPRYYFDVRDGEKLTTDGEGLEMEGFDAARNEAVRSLPELAKDELPDGDSREFEVVVRDDRGPVLRASLSFAVERLA